MAQGKKIAVNVVLGPEASRSLQDTLARLDRAGFERKQVLGAIGIVSGHVAEHDLPALQRVPGVTVERDEEVRIPPPDSGIQ